GVQGDHRLLNHSRFPNGRAHGFAALANIGVLRAGRAQPLYLLTPPGRFALRATAHRADASLRRAAGRFGPSAQVPTGHTLPFGAPKPYAAAFFVSVASVRRTQETRLFPKPWVFQRSAPAAPMGGRHSVSKRPAQPDSFDTL